MITLLLNRNAVEETAQYRCLMTFWALHLIASFVFDTLFAFIFALQMVQTSLCRKLATGLVLVLLSLVHLDKIVILKTSILHKSKSDHFYDFGVANIIKNIVQGVG
jgi:hypothetical protein